MHKNSVGKFEGKRPPLKSRHKWQDIVACRPVARQRQRNNRTMAVTRQRPVNSNTGIVFSARSTPMAAHATMDTATEERCFLCGP
jgi:hypothetical protein